MSNLLFNNALNRVSQKIPPIWFMRQAGRYHSHYQNLKKNYSFEDLCKNPELSAKTALGPIEDFDFDVSILFSDILFPLEALGMSLKYDPGPIFSKFIDHSNFSELKNVEDAILDLNFQSEALKITRDILPKNKSLIGFVGGPWTVTSYGTGMNKGMEYEGNFRNDFVYKLLTKKIIPLLKKNIELQISSGAEIVMIFDTDAARIGNSKDFYDYSDLVYNNLIKPFDNKVGFFAKHPFDYNFFIETINSSDDKALSGIGFDHTFEISHWLRKTKRGFIQGNFNQESMVKAHDEFKKDFDLYIDNFQDINEIDRAGWVCGLGHGILKETPEENVHYFIENIRKIFS